MTGRGVESHLLSWVLIFIAALWPIIAFMGGLGFSPLLMLAGVVVAVHAIPRIRFRAYMVMILLFMEFVAASSKWSPQPTTFFEIDLMRGSFAVRFEAIRVGLDLVWTAFLLTYARSLEPAVAQRILRVVSIGILVHLVLVALLSIFQQQALDLFYGHTSDKTDGVQNIARNGIILAISAPLLIVGAARALPFARALLVELAVFSAIIVVLLIRGVDSGILSILMGLGCVGLIRFFPANGFKILGVAFGFVVVSAPLFFKLISQGAEASTISTSANWRLAIWKRVLEVVDEEPFFGHGVGVLRTMKELIPAGEMKGQMLIPNHAHNMILQLWVETGATGASLVALAMIFAGFRMPPPRTLGVAGFLAAALAGQFMTVALVSFDLWADWWWACAGILAVMTTVVWRAETTDNSSRLIAAPPTQSGETRP